MSAPRLQELIVDSPSDGKRVLLSVGLFALCAVIFIFSATASSLIQPALGLVLGMLGAMLGLTHARAVRARCGQSDLTLQEIQRTMVYPSVLVRAYRFARAPDE